MDGIGHDLPDLLDPAQLLHRGGGEPVDRSVGGGQRPGHGYPDMGNAQRGQEPPERLLLARRDGGQEVLDTLLTHPLQRQELFRAQFIEIGDITE